MTRGKKYQSVGTLQTIFLFKTHIQDVPYKTQPHTLNNVFYFHVLRHQECHKK